MPAEGTSKDQTRSEAVEATSLLRPVTRNRPAEVLCFVGGTMKRRRRVSWWGKSCRCLCVGHYGACAGLRREESQQRHQYPRDQSAWRVLGRFVRHPERAPAEGLQCAGLSCRSWRVLD